MSLYASAGCDFVRVDVGFTPSNEAWNQSTAELGLFFYQSGILAPNKYRAAILDGCERYEYDFNEAFINEDRTWKVARIMAYISGGASMVATVTAWLFVFTPLPAFLFWPGVLLPALMAAFLAEGSKFLFFDTSICRTTVWYPSGDESLPRAAEECVLGNTGLYAIAAGTIFFVSLVLVCLKAPQKRKLQSNYGREGYGKEEDVENAMENVRSDRSYDDKGSAVSYASSDHRFSFSHSRGTSRGDAPEMRSPDYGSYGEDGFHEGESQTSRPTNLDDDDLISVRLKNLDPEEDKYTAKPIDDLEKESTDDRYNPKKPPPIPATPEQTVSKSRLHARERMELNSAIESEDLIQKFVNDLNISFQVDNTTETKTEKPLEKPVEKPGFFQNLCAVPNTTTTDKLCATNSA